MKRQDESFLIENFKDENKLNIKGLKDTTISKLVGIPKVTLSWWKKDKNSYRQKFYKFLKRQDESFLIENFKDEL